MRNIDLGCGLIAIGREWGTTKQVPTQREALAFLEFAYTLGVRRFDTAPSYGLSETRFGRFLANLPTEERENVIVSTKFGEHWDTKRAEPYTDHTLSALRKSLYRSLGRLGKIDILFLHKARPELLDDEGVNEAWEEAKKIGVALLGISIGDRATAEAAIADDRFSVIQLPYNQANQQFSDVIDRAQQQGKIVYVNRPLQMGAALRADQKSASLQAAYQHILNKNFVGTILSGTSQPEHLQENWLAFQTASSGL